MYAVFIELELIDIVFLAKESSDEE
jgi:hypothetical protein